MTVQEKIEQILIDGEYITTSPKEVDEIIKTATAQGYDFSTQNFEDYEIKISRS